MGTVSSKAEEDVQEEEISEGSVPSTPILTPKIKTLRELDPRSPSNNVIRTPIETLLMKHNNLKKDGPFTLVECSPRLKYLNIDPRSPTTDFDRTPIVVIQDENDVVTTPKMNAVGSLAKRKSYVLLETNLDYIETDIDAAYLKNTPQRGSTNIESFVNKNETESIDRSHNVEDENEMQTLTKEIEAINLDVDATEQLKQENQLVEDNKVVPDDLDICNEKLLTKKRSDISADAESLPKDLTVVINNVKDFDKKLTNLIYEDAESPAAKRSDTPQNYNRTPLATRNGNLNTRKKAPKLKVTDRPKKYKQQFSKIPISKQNRKNEISVQCENTPPRNLRERKGKMRRPDWDADKTLII